MSKTGKMVVVSAPSGAGKTSIVKALLDKSDLGLAFSVSACTRPIRGNETDGIDYYFMSVDTFRKKIDEDAFVEWEEVYEDQYYGTLKSELDRIWDLRKTVIFDVDVVGGLNIKKKYPDQTLAIFIKPPSIQALESRLRKRSTDNDSQIMKRLRKATYEMGFAHQFDAQILNENLEDAIQESIRLVESFIKS